MEGIVAQRRFFIWRLEYWWVAFDLPPFHPEDRRQLRGGWFWREKENKND